MQRLEDDFYTHINAEWLEKNKIPSEYTKWSNFHILNKVNEERLKEILNCDPTNDEENKLNILWKKGLNTEELNSHKHDSIFKLINEDLPINQLLVSLLKYNLCFLFDIEAYTDFKDSNRNILYFDRLSLSLPDRDYYLIDKMEDKRILFKQFLDKFLQHYKINNANNNITNNNIAEEIYSFEESIAKVLLSKTEKRDPNKIYNLYAFYKLKEQFKNIDWDYLFDSFNFPKDDKIIITEPKYFEFLNNYLENTDNHRIIKNYFKYRLAKYSTNFCDDISYQLTFDFFGNQLMGQKEPKQRWKRVLSTIESILGEVLSKAYIQKYFKEDEKKSCKNMIEEICKTYRERIINLDWMSDITKQKALEKLDKITIKIGYPDKWTDFANLNLSSNMSYFENMLEANRWILAHNLEKLYKPVDKLEWHMNAHEINAYYSPTNNEIVFPAGILQEPFYSINQSIAENLGGIGAVIGHEMSHGFDDNGRLYDSDGNLNEWWSKEDEIQFNERSKKLEELFNLYEYFGIKVNGKLTLGENIADLGGLTFSLKTLERIIFNNNNTKLEDIKTETKKLFEQWAKIWRCNITDDTLKNQLLTDPHSPTNLRVNAILRNLDEFYEIYNITENDKMYLDKQLRSKIW
jgi:putative endopeptidase